MSDHVVFTVTGRVHCLHCGSQYAVNLPAPVAIFNAIGDTFAADHAGCPMPTNGIPVLEWQPAAGGDEAMLRVDYGRSLVTYYGREAEIIKSRLEK